MNLLTVDEVINCKKDILTLISECFCDNRPVLERDYLLEQYNKLIFNLANKKAYLIGHIEDGELKCMLWCYKIQPVNEVRMHIGFVSTKASERKKGYGKAMIKVVRNICLEQHIKFIELRVMENNVDAIRFYKSLGFHNEEILMKSNIKDMRAI